MGFSSCGSWALEHRLIGYGPRALCSCGSWALEHRLVGYGPRASWLWLPALEHRLIGYGPWASAAVAPRPWNTDSSVTAHGLRVAVAPGPWSTDSSVMAHGLRGCGSQALEHRLIGYGPRASLSLWQVGSPQIRNRACLSCTGRRSLYHWGTRETLKYLYIQNQVILLFKTLQRLPRIRAGS